MYGRFFVHGLRLKRPEPMSLYAVFLSLCILFGAAGGYLVAASCDPSVQTALGDYLRDYCTLLETGDPGVSILECAFLFLGPEIAVFLASFSPFGVLMVPLFAALYGFGAMYTVTCFVMTYGRQGIATAISLFSVRLVFSMPCFLALGAESWPICSRSFFLGIGRKGRHEPQVYRKRFFLVFLWCCLLLVIGMCCERLLTPRLFSAVVRGLT